MRRIAALLVAGSLTFGGMTATAAPAYACAGVKCTVDCIRRYLSGTYACPD